MDVFWLRFRRGSRGSIPIVQSSSDAGSPRVTTTTGLSRLTYRKS
nr:MAG TPA: hypothetical protein [Bacteriophage sp.]